MRWLTSLPQRSLIILLVLGLGVMFFLVSPKALAAAEAPKQVAAPAVTEQLTEPSSSLPRTELDTSSISSEKVNQFVAACIGVVNLIERRQSEWQASETESESSRIEQDIEAEALKIIESHGLTRQEYLQLLGLANSDPEFGDRVATLLQESAR
jgi:hypothetical protein